MTRCICLDDLPLIPQKGFRIRPKLDCPKHKTLAANWDKIKTREQFNEALRADGNEIQVREG